MRQIYTRGSNGLISVGLTIYPGWEGKDIAKVARQMNEARRKRKNAFASWLKYRQAKSANQGDNPNGQTT